jgi:hypothetical protein
VVNGRITHYAVPHTTSVLVRKCPLGVTSGNALTDRKISAWPLEPDVYAMNTRPRPIVGTEPGALGAIERRMKIHDTSLWRPEKDEQRRGPRTHPLPSGALPRAPRLRIRPSAPRPRSAEERSPNPPKNREACDSSGKTIGTCYTDHASREGLSPSPTCHPGQGGSRKGMRPFRQRYGSRGCQPPR